MIEVASLTKRYGEMVAVDDLSFTVRPGIVTGFLGGLTTFSTFSAEAVGTLMRGESGWAILLVLAHLIGSLVLTGAGVLIAHEPHQGLELRRGAVRPPREPHRNGDASRTGR